MSGIVRHQYTILGNHFCECAFSVLFETYAESQVDVSGYLAGIVFPRLCGKRRILIRENGGGYLATYENTTSPLLQTNTFTP